MTVITIDELKIKPYVVLTVSDHPIFGQTQHFVCSECGVDVDYENGLPFCINHGFIEDHE